MNFRTAWVGAPTSDPRPGPAVVIADTETGGGGPDGGLRLPFLPDGRRIWDVCLCRRNPDGTDEWYEAFVALEDLPFDLDDPDALEALNRFGRFDARHPQRRPPGVGPVVPCLREAALAADLMHMFRPTDGMTGRAAKPVLVGAVPSFEDLSLGDLLRRHGMIDSEPPWHYHLYDIETAAAARLGWRPHWDSKKLSRALGVDPGLYDAHTARGDVEWAMAVYDAVYAPLWQRWASRLTLAVPAMAKSWSGRQRPPQGRSAA